MTDAEFIKLVADMRQAQRTYFRDRSPAALDLSKKLERQVDAAITEAKESSLFAGK